MMKLNQAYRLQILCVLMNKYNKTWEEAENILKYLKNLETQIHGWMEGYCDGEIYKKYWNEDGENEILNKLIKKAEKYIQKNIGCKFFISHDPCGCAIRLYLENFSNTLDGTTSLHW